MSAAHKWHYEIPSDQNLSMGGRTSLFPDAPPQINVNNLLPVVQTGECGALRANPGIVEQDSHLQPPMLACQCSDFAEKKK